jgi:o-succinylbenzoate---CoA ligase
MQVEGWLPRAAAARPEHPALETAAGSWSYAELLAQARAGADALRADGVRCGERVAIALPAGLEFVQALHACLLLGAIAVPLDVRSPSGDRERLAEDAVMLLDEPLPGAREGGVVGRGPCASREQEPATSPQEAHDLDAVALVVHTSGTTTSPRPVELSYGNILWSALGSAVALDLDPAERWLCALPLAHVGGLSILLRSAIYATTALVHERFDTARVVHTLGEREVTLLSLVATTLERLLDAGLERPRGLRCALTGGGPVPRALVERALAAGVPVALTYGLTEASSQVTTTPAAWLAGGRAEAGPPLFCTRVRIGRDGEILLAGPTIARGSLDADGWLRTGDFGELDGEGRLSVTGRKADTIVSGGENVAPAEVEAVLETHPDVLEAAVLGRPDERWGEAVTAIVVTRPGRVLDGEALRSHCAGSLAPYKVPKRVILSGGPLPRTASGKLLRRELR